MRIIAGRFKGRNLVSSPDLSIRPTTDKVKELIFNILQDIPEGKKVVDLFCGSGSLGLEAISRGATSVVFVEKSRASIQILEKNIEHLGLDSLEYKIINNDALNFARINREEFDLYLLDPPYDYPPLQELINLITGNKYFNSGNLLVVEHEIINPVLPENGGYLIIKQKKVGRSLISFISKKEFNG
jgi:16S rRNA (guanine(966)-N(2))-methyltransferase RsmD